MLYHEHLRKDLPSADSVQYRHLPLRGITQKEQDGLIAFLQLTTVIVNWVSKVLFVLLEYIFFFLADHYLSVKFFSPERWLGKI